MGLGTRTGLVLWSSDFTWILVLDQVDAKKLQIVHRFDTLTSVCKTRTRCRFNSSVKRLLCAEVAELADAHGSGPCTRKGVGVRVPSSAPIYSIVFSNFSKKQPK